MYLFNKFSYLFFLHTKFIFFFKKKNLYSNTPTTFFSTVRFVLSQLSDFKNLIESVFPSEDFPNTIRNTHKNTHKNTETDIKIRRTDESI